VISLIKNVLNLEIDNKECHWGENMNEKIQGILQQIDGLEEQLEDVLHEQKIKMYYNIEGKRIRFEEAVHEANRKLKMDLLPWFRDSRPRNLLSAPLIYGMIFPFVFLDCCVSIYHAICFRLYGIPLVQRNNYIVIDRHHLGFLNIIEKFNCVYCSYGNGVLAYAREIAARTEQYWCPIKHAHKILGTHDRHDRFINYGEAADYHTKVEGFRTALIEK
jgi:hypothetical protein